MQIIPGYAVPEAQLRLLATGFMPDLGRAYPAWTLEDAVRELANATGLPRSLVAAAGDAVVGCASLLADDEVDGWEGTSPWLGNLWVEPDHRGRGYGTALVEAVASLARDSGATTLHLVTDSAADWYRHLGWRERGMAAVHGSAMFVFERDLA